MDVIVAGAGPAGLMLAAELRLQGVATVVLERLAAPTGYSKAAGLHARSAETMELRGLLDVLAERGRAARERVFARQPELLAALRGSPGRWPVRGHFSGIQKLRLDDLDTNQPGMLGISQATLEEVLGQRALDLGAEVRRGHELAGVEQDDEGVTVTVRGPAGEYRLRAAYLAGCDGGRSAVRRLAGFAFPGTDPTSTSRLADIAVPDLLADPGMGHHRTPTGYLLVTPFRVLCVERGVAADRDAPMTVEEMSAALSRVAGREVRLPGEPAWMSRFTDVTRLAEPYRIGRVLLAGDAAHVHSPAGGQGLNLGLQDAVNLGWKLASAVRGVDLLDSYGAERRPVAARVLDNTRAQTALSDPDPAVTPLRELFAELMELDAVNRHLGNMISALDLNYETCHGFLPDISLGSFTARSLLHRGHPILLDLADDPALRATAAPWPVEVVTARADTPHRALFVRPDGYIAWQDSASEPLTAALTRWLGAREGHEVRASISARAASRRAGSQ